MDVNGLSPTSEVWVETTTPQGRPYFYHLRTRETKWAKPDNVLVIKQEDLPKLAEKLGVQTGASAGSTANAVASANSDGSAVVANGTASMQNLANPAGNYLQTPQTAMPFGMASPAAANVSGTPQAVTASGATAGMPQHLSYNNAGMPPGTGAAPPALAGRPPWMPPSTLASGLPTAGFPPLIFGANPATTMAGASGFPPPPHMMMANGGMFPPPGGMLPPQMMMPPSMMQFMPPFMMPQQPQKPTVSATDWTEYKTPDNRPYWYNSKTGKSSWEKPQEVAEADKLQKSVPAKKPDTDKPPVTAAAAAAMTTDKPKPKPISTKAVPGTAWCVVWTNDGKHFFYNPTTKSSVWKLPLDLATNPDVDGIVARGPAAAPAAAVNSTEKAATDTAANKVTDSVRIQSKGSDSLSVGTTAEKSAATPPAVVAAETATTASLMLKADTREGAIAVERNAAKERENIPLAERIERFQKLLEEKNVEPTSTWEKELSKIVFDPRYLLINSKERKEAFDAYCSKKIEFVREEKRRKQKETKEAFFQMMRESGMTSSSMTFSEFRTKFAKDERLKAVERYTDREDYFRQYITELRDKEREEKREKGEKVKREFLELLVSLDGLHRKSDWYEVKKRIAEDPRYLAVDSSSQRTTYFDEYRRTLAKKPKRKPSPGEIMTDDDDDDVGAVKSGGEGSDTTGKRQRKKSVDRHERKRSVDRRSRDKTMPSKSIKRDDGAADKSSRSKSDRRDAKRRSRETSDDAVDREDADEDDRDVDERTHRRNEERSRRSSSRHRRGGSKRPTHRRSGSRSDGRYKAEDDDERPRGHDIRRAGAGRFDRRSVSKDDGFDSSMRSSARNRDKSADNTKASAKRNRGDVDDLSDDASRQDGDFDRRRDNDKAGSNRNDKKRHRSKTPTEANDTKERKPKSSGKSVKRLSTLSPVNEEEEESKTVKRNAKKHKSNTDDEKSREVAAGAVIKHEDTDDEEQISKYALKKRADDVKAIISSGKFTDDDEVNEDEADLKPVKIKAEDDAEDEYDDDEEERAVAAAEAERQARFDASLRKRREEVEQKMSSINMETQRERQQSKLNEARAAFQQLLNDHIRHTEYDYHDARKKLKKSKNYDELISGVLDKAEREALFDAHIAALKGKKKERFFALLREHNVQLDSKWSQIQPQIVDGARYEKFSSSERKCEKAFREYRDQVLPKEARADFRQMLRESAVMRFSLTQPDNNVVSSGNNAANSSSSGGGVNNKMLEKLLSNDKDAWLELQVQLEDDKRYVRMGVVDEHERREILQDYIVDLAKRAGSGSGAPIPQQQ